MTNRKNYKIFIAYICQQDFLDFLICCIFFYRVDLLIPLIYSQTYQDIYDDLNQFRNDRFEEH